MSRTEHNRGTKRREPISIRLGPRQLEAVRQHAARTVREGTPVSIAVLRDTPLLKMVPASDLRNVLRAMVRDEEDLRRRHAVRTRLAEEIRRKQQEDRTQAVAAARTQMTADFDHALQAERELVHAAEQNAAEQQRERKRVAAEVIKLRRQLVQGVQDKQKLERKLQDLEGATTDEQAQLMKAFADSLRQQTILTEQINRVEGHAKQIEDQKKQIEAEKKQVEDEKKKIEDEMTADRMRAKTHAYCASCESEFRDAIDQLHRRGAFSATWTGPMADKRSRKMDEMRHAFMEIWQREKEPKFFTSTMFHTYKTEAEVTLKTWWSQRCRIVHEPAYADGVDHAQFHALSELFLHIIRDLMNSMC